MNAILALDQGTTSSRAIVFDHAVIGTIDTALTTPSNPPAIAEVNLSQSLRWSSS